MTDLSALIRQARTDAAELARVHLAGDWGTGSQEILGRYIRETDVPAHVLAADLVSVAAAALRRLPEAERTELLEDLARDPLEYLLTRDAGIPEPPGPESAVPPPASPPSPARMPRQRKRTRGGHAS